MIFSSTTNRGRSQITNITVLFICIRVALYTFQLFFEDATALTVGKTYPQRRQSILCSYNLPRFHLEPMESLLFNWIKTKPFLSRVWVRLKPSYCKGRSSQNQAKSEALLAQTTSTRITFDQNLIMI
jgi:hypothetical protein